jgi:hypothetical protein
MAKRIIALVLILLTAFPFAACSDENTFTLSYTPDGSDKIDYIFYTEERVVYVVGGLMMIKLGDEPMMLEMALSSGAISIEEIIERSEADFIDGKLETVAYPDGSREYCYDGFKMIVLNTHLRNVDVYFTPSSMSFYDVYQR